MKMDDQCDYNFGRKKKEGIKEGKKIWMDMQQNVNSGYLC